MSASIENIGERVARIKDAAGKKMQPIRSTLAITLPGVWLLNVADYFLTCRALAAGAVEVNPVMAMVVGTPLFPAVKLVAVPLLLLLIWRLRHRVKRTAAYVWVPLVVYSMLMVWHLIIWP